jgi:hypothetical protein
MTDPHFAQLLELAASSAFNRPPPEIAVRALSKLGPSDETRLLELLREHRLQHLFWDAVTRCEEPQILSSNLRETLRSDFETARQVHAAHEWELISLSDALARAGIPVIACKGIVLARHYYPRPGLRRMHDIDLWLLEHDISGCRRELEKLGYRERLEKAAPEAHNLINDDGIVLDVHTAMRLFQDKGHDLRDLTTPAPGLPYLVFRPEAQVATSGWPRYYRRWTGLSAM